ncbi:hypothetical protein [Actinomyces radicidentis]|uniref:Uncharacterized protein n=1 Tax=Actinomyces radicidentis TaxID=111015 RepID=A0A120KL90_ACTRD|nr:hypothetical protein [Actinomyces radicidentis]AMD87571.1 hypothetical protein AXF14_08220 [Actinomyces radicidentis]
MDDHDLTTEEPDDDELDGATTVIPPDHRPPWWLSVTIAVADTGVTTARGERIDDLLVDETVLPST